MMAVRRAWMLLPLAVVTLGGCSGVRETMGIDKKPPDEFAVVRRAPLTVPPNFELRPPRPGERAVPEIDPRVQAQTAVFGVASTPRPAAESSGEEALLRTLQIESYDPDIRRKVDEESALMAVDQRNLVERMMFWRTPPPPGTAVDASMERRRLQENDALGQSQTTGETPSIERKDTVRSSIF